MGTDTRTIRGLVQAHLDTLGRLSEKERANRPSGRYGTEFNKLLTLAKEAAPEVDARAWPAPLSIEDNSHGVLIVFADFRRHRDECPADPVAVAGDLLKGQ